MTTPSKRSSLFVALIGGGLIAGCSGKDAADSGGDSGRGAGAVDCEPVDWFIDYDGDGYGVDGAYTERACDPPSGFVDNADDCDDEDAAVNPDADEICGGGDEDCDGETDEDGALEAPLSYPDADGDGYGAAGTEVALCDTPSGYVAVDGDCDDSDAAAYPGAPEWCDGLWTDCAAAWGDDAGLATYRDRDGAPTDVTADLMLGTNGAPADYALTEGALHLCAGTWYAAVYSTADDGAIVGYPSSDSVILSGGGADRPLEVAGGILALSDLTISDGVAEKGGGIYAWSDAAITLDRVVVEDNAAESAGGGIWSDATLAQLTDSVVRDNTLSGAEDAYGAGIYAHGILLAMTDSSVEGNVIADAENNAYGAGIYLRDGELDLERVELSGNGASCSNRAWGGGAYLSDGADASLSDVRIVGNSALGADASSFGFGAGLTVVDSGTDAVGENVLIAGNEAGGDGSCGGGGLMVDDAGAVALTNAILSGNAADCDAAYGGAVYVSDSDTAGLSLVNVDVFGNVSADYGGAIYGAFELPDVSLLNVSLVGNQAFTGGGIYNAGSGSVDASYSNLYGNTEPVFYGLGELVGVDNNISEDPQYADTSGSDPLDWDLTISSGSPLVDMGDPAILDADKSRSDIGAYGGPGGVWP